VIRFPRLPYFICFFKIEFSVGTDPVGYVRSDGTNQVVYRDIYGDICGLSLPFQAKAWQENLGSPVEIADGIRAWGVLEVFPGVQGVPAAYDRSDNVHSVLFRGADNHIYELAENLADLSRAAAAQ
jgi:hypothetical protein